MRDPFRKSPLTAVIIGATAGILFSTALPKFLYKGFPDNPYVVAYASRWKYVQAELLQQQINTYVSDTGNGEWICSLDGGTFTIGGQEARTQRDLRAILGDGLKAGACRAVLPSSSQQLLPSGPR